jgi:hypothetical protein
MFFLTLVKSSRPFSSKEVSRGTTVKTAEFLKIALKAGTTGVSGDMFIGGV